MIRIYLVIFLFLALLITACSPHKTQTFATTPTLSFQLPPECQNTNPNISQEIYSAYDFESIPCEYLSISPDGASIVFVTLAQVSVSEDSDGIRRVAKLFSTSSSETIQIYESKCAFLYPEWTSTGHLIISDVPYDSGCEYTAIYDLTQKRILLTLEGAVRRNYQDSWSEDKTAFFLLTPNIFGPTCNENLSGFDLSSETKFPALKPTSPNTNLYVVIGEPIWMPDNKTLLVTIRDGVCSQEDNLACEYSNSYIVEYNFSGSSPKINFAFYDPALDYSFQKKEEGIVEFKSVPFKPVTCLEVN